MKQYVIEIVNIGTGHISYLDFDQQCGGVAWFPSTPAKAHFFASREAAQAEIDRWKALELIDVKGVKHVPSLLRNIGNFTATTRDATLHIRLVELSGDSWSSIVPTVVSDCVCHVCDQSSTDEATISFTT